VDAKIYLLSDSKPKRNGDTDLFPLTFISETFRRETRTEQTREMPCETKSNRSNVYNSKERSDTSLCMEGIAIRISWTQKARMQRLPEVLQSSLSRGERRMENEDYLGLNSNVRMNEKYSFCVASQKMRMHYEVRGGLGSCFPARGWSSRCYNRLIPATAEPLATMQDGNEVPEYSAGPKELLCEYLKDRLRSLLPDALPPQRNVEQEITGDRVRGPQLAHPCRFGATGVRAGRY
jgi:hypothetical protein